MKKAKAKLYEINEKGDRDLSKERLAKFDNIYPDNMVSKKQKETISAELIDSLFFFEEAQTVYKTFVKFDTDV